MEPRQVSRDRARHGSRPSRGDRRSHGRVTTLETRVDELRDQLDTAREKTRQAEDRARTADDAAREAKVWNVT